MQPTRAVKLFGTDEPVASARTLRAGALEARLEDGALRGIKVGGVEAIRGIAFLARDKNWGTFAADIRDLDITENADGFRITYTASAGDASQSLTYTARIEGRSDGSLEFSADGVPQTEFTTNRTGFVVLHPLAGVVGCPVTVEHTDGQIVESAFPTEINPACPFQDIRALTHHPLPGVRVTCRMEGDAFEMEDHRNWLDASFKTYVRPLAKPWPYVLAKGEPFTQRVSLTVEGASDATASADAGGVRLCVGEVTQARMPRLGLAVPAEEAAAALSHAAALSAAAPGFLVCHFDARQGHDAATVARHKALGDALGVPLVLEAVVPCQDGEGRPTDDAAILERDLAVIAQAAVGATWERVAVSPASDLKCTLPGSVFPPAPSWEALFAAARERFPGVPVGGGMFSYFTELNRKRPPAAALDFVCHSGAPIVHAGDDESVMETLEALPSVFHSVRAFMGDVPYWVFPTAVSMRMNPYGAAPAENPNNIRQAMNRIDPRDRALLGAAWYVGYLAHAAAAGVDAVTLGAVAGPSGIVNTKGDIARPYFDASDAAVMPSFHAFAFGAAAAGRPIRELTTSTSMVAAVAFEGENGPALLCANTTPEPVTIRVEGLGPSPTLAVLDEESFEAACAAPSALPSRSAGEETTLDAYAIALFTAQRSPH